MLKSLPNILTLMRLVLTIVFLGMILYVRRAANLTTYVDLTFALFLVTSLTDVVDGHVARRFNATSKFGRMADPLADKVLVCGSFICFAIIGEPTLFSLPPASLAVIHWSVAGILIAREAYVTVLRQLAEARGINFAATRSGKFKMLSQSFAIGTILVKMAHFPAALWSNVFVCLVFAVMIGATVVSGILATRRSSLQRLKGVNPSCEPSMKSV
jgi:CDP-diacylglycerol---glycerol-3-phosphate 3-phosphatidyltransferase